MSIEVRGITKQFNNFTALNNVDLTVKDGELIALLGPSGSGKTTLLRVIAGLEHADAGAVLVNGEDTSMQTLRERRVGFVFQHYALFRHMTVFENVAFGLRVRPRAKRPTEERIRARVNELLKLVQLEQMAMRYPSQLSGGQRQRVALCRALAVEPDVLLLDEPFGALDAKVRKELRRWLRRLHDELHVTSVFVTHDQEEALEVADRVVVMNQGRIEQIGTPEEVYHSPATPFVYDFLGDVNFFTGRVENGRMIAMNPRDGGEHGEANVARMFVRPHALDVTTTPSGSEIVQARVTHIFQAGPLVKLELHTPWGDDVQVSIPQERFRELNLGLNSEVFLTPREAKVYVEDYVI